MPTIIAISEMMCTSVDSVIMYFILGVGVDCIVVILS